MTHLSLVTNPVAVPAGPVVEFCGQCAHEPDHSFPGSRICAHCGMGVVLSADAALAPKPGESFIIVDSQLRVCALSEAAANELLVNEDEVVHQPLADLLELADVHANASLSHALFQGSDEPVSNITVRPVGVRGVFYRARVGACGEPPATLVVFGR